MHRRLAALLLLGGIVAAACRAPSRAVTADAREGPLRVLEAQVDAWNAGDLEGFVRLGYRWSEETTFFSGDLVKRGAQELLARYRATYGAPGAEMGVLAFEELDVLPLARDASLVRGRWRLTFEREHEVGGLFTLLFRRLPEGWRIVHDHTSGGAPPPAP